MALSWDVKEVTAIPNTDDEWKAWCEQVSYDQPHLPEEQRYTNWQLLDALIWRSLVLAWGWKLKPALVETAIKRNAIYERVHGGGVIIPPAFIADMVGMHTNVSPASDAEFHKNVRRWLAEHATNVYRRHLAAAEAKHEAEVEASVAEHERQIAEAADA